MHGGTQTGPRDDALAQLREWDPAGAEMCARMSANPWRNGVLPRRLAELIGLAVNVSGTRDLTEELARQAAGA